MKTMRVLLLGVVLLAVSVSSYGLALCDYHSPVTSLTGAGLSFGYRYFNDGGTPDVDVNSGRVGLGFDSLFDSPNIGYSFSGNAEIALSEFMPVSWLGQGAGTFRYYVTEGMPFFAYGGAEGSVSPGIMGLEIRAGVGYGRFSDVTPLAKSLTIEAELMELEAIVDPLPDEILMSIAEVIGREVEYATLKELVADIEALIEGASGVDLDARALLTIEEVVLEVGDDRKCGWAIQGGIGYELIDPLGGDRDIVLAASADAAFASGPDDQLLFHASFSGPFEIMDENTLSASFDYEYQLTEDSRLLADYALQRLQAAPGDVRIYHAASMTLSFNLGGADIGLQVGLSRDPADPDWSTDISISAAMDLL